MNRVLFFAPEHACYVVRWTASLTKEASVAHWQDLVERPEFSPGLAALHDMRGVTIPRSYEETAEVGKIYRRDIEPRVGFGRVALLVDDADNFGQAERLTNALELAGTLVTYSEREAREWVGLPTDFELADPAL